MSAPQNTPTLEPLTATAGDTFAWTRDLNYLGFTPAAWTLSYTLVPKTTGNAKITITATDNGDGTFYVSVAPSTTETYTPDEYIWKAMVTSTTSTERHTLFQGRMEITADFATAAQANFQSGVKNTLDALEAMIQGKLSVDQQSVSVMGKSITKMSIKEVLDAYNYYKELYAKELREENNAQRRPGASKVLIRFGSTTSTKPRNWPFW